MKRTKITALRTFVAEATAGRTWLFVVVETSAGLRGVGEASQSRLDAAVIEQIRALSSAYVGEDPLDLIEARGAALRRPDAHRIFFAAVSGIEQALWDLVGQLLGVPVYSLLGGSHRDAVSLYANVSLACGDGSPEACAAAASQAVEDGFSAVKIDAYDALPDLSANHAAPMSQRNHDLAVARVAAVRAAVGPMVKVLIDCAFRITRGEAISFAERVVHFDPYWIEEPVPMSDRHQLSEIRHQIHGRLAAGEQLCARESFRELLEARGVDVVMPDVKWVGGISELRKIASLAETFGAELAPHNMSGPIATAASLHVALASANFTLLEYCWGGPSWRGELVGGLETVIAGSLGRPSAPGLGLTLDLESPRLREI